jgi:hypothetical protein
MEEQNPSKRGQQQGLIPRPTRGAGVVKPAEPWGSINGTPLFIWLPGVALCFTVGGFAFGLRDMIKGQGTQGRGMGIRVTTQLLAVSLMVGSVYFALSGRQLEKEYERERAATRDTSGMTVKEMVTAKHAQENRK